MRSSCPDGFPPRSPSLSAASAHPSHVDNPSSLLGDLLGLHYVFDMLMTSKSITQTVLLNCSSLRHLALSTGIIHPLGHLTGTSYSDLLN